MSSPIFFSTKTQAGYWKRSELLIRNMLRPLEECHFNQVTLVCPRCKIGQVYNNFELCGDTFIVCDYCCFNIPFKYDHDHDFNKELGTYIRSPTVISRL